MTSRMLFILFIFCHSIAVSSTVIAEDDSLMIYKYENEWSSLSIRVGFGEDLKLRGGGWYDGHHISKYNPFNPFNPFKPLPNTLKRKIFSNDTNNPYKKIYSSLYTSNSKQELLDKCPFYGVIYDLDNNVKTTEWIIVAPTEDCLYGRTKLGYLKGYYQNAQHTWILQKDSQGSYQLLMEADDHLILLNNQQSLGYKSLKTSIYLGRVSREDASICGSAEIVWQFRDGKYYPQKSEASTDGCSSLFHNIRNTTISPDAGASLRDSISESDWINYKKLPKVEKQVERLVSDIKRITSGGRDTITVNSSLKERSVQNNHQPKDEVDSFSHKELQALKALLDY